MVNLRMAGCDTLADPATIAALHEQFSILDKFENYVIETVGHSPDETLAAVEAGLVSGRFQLSDHRGQNPV